METSKMEEKTLGFSNVEKILKSKYINRGDTYRGIRELQRDLEENDDLRKAFLNVKSSEEAIEIAQDLGYEINSEEIENNKELVESMFESVAGGRAKVKIRNYSFKSNTIASGKKSKVYTGVKWIAGGE